MADTKKRILVVEDEHSLSHALELKLGHEGYSVTVAQNGQECLAKLRSEHFDVVLLDLIMPEMDGFQVLAELQKQHKHPIVYVLSNLSQHEDEERVLALGAKKFFIKSDTPLTVIIDEIKHL